MKYIVILSNSSSGKQKCPDCHHDSRAFLCLTHKPSVEGSYSLFLCYPNGLSINLLPKLITKT